MGCLEYFYINCAKRLTAERGSITRYFHPFNDATADVYALAVSEPDSSEDRPVNELLEAEECEAIGTVYAGLDWYERKLIDLYLGGWSARKIYRETGITDKEVYRVIREFKAKVLELL